MRVDQVMLLYIVFEAVEISGDVACWLRFVGILVGVFVFSTSKSVPASTRLEDPSRKGTTRTAKSAPFNPCPSREGPYSST